MRLLLIRHGETPGNVLGQLDTAHPGPGLTDLGERQGWRRREDRRQIDHRRLGSQSRGELATGFADPLRTKGMI